MNDFQIAPITRECWADVARIYEAGIATKNATFETKVPDYDTWDNAHRKDCRLVVTTQGKIVGWIALSNVSNRCVYAGVAEVSIYIDPAFQGQGLGNLLMIAIIKESEQQGIWTLQAGVFPENTASLKLHQKQGFRVLGVKERIGKMDGKWRDVVALERRSGVVGVE